MKSALSFARGKEPMQSFEEKRKFKRYEGKEGHDVFVAVRPAFVRIGALKDISLSGLGFKYSITDEHTPLSDKEAPVSIDLFVSNNGFYLSNLKCKLAYDKFEESYSFMQFRQCGLAFHDPTPQQKEQITHFLEHYTMGSA